MNCSCGDNVKRLEWTDQDASAAVGEPCALCFLSRRYRPVRPAIVLAVLVGFNSGGGGAATLQPVCEHHARQRNVIPCRGL